MKGVVAASRAAGGEKVDHTLIKPGVDTAALTAVLTAAGQHHILKPGH